ncbi:class I mannose-6-phosphate isomerase [Lacticaseibacillus zhaodongensis]|uniref:class I mannose-6-phosphate isomerase n=1 Tax=Lacticaseibacillus zhaodongensis TaxID=2668065 RepID=UPI0012D2FA63|nr:class I mannose-6-phosphate isomerase [Lacticaseibacillus zhaodongensis]
MLLLQSFSAPRVWGSERMRDYGATAPSTGSVYSVAGTSKLNVGAIDTETGRQKTLRDFVNENPAQFGLQKGEVYPVIVDMLGADQDLSIQDHPSDAYARTQGEPYGKDESWLFLTAPTSGTVYSGLQNPQVKPTAADFSSGDPLPLLGTEPVAAGDYIFVPNGTLHAIRAGSLVYEIQQSTDITYRFYDYQRTGLDGQPRPLQLDQALANLVPTNKVSKQHPAANAVIEEKAYTLDIRITAGDGDYTAPAGIASCMTVIQGQLDLKNRRIRQGTSVMILPREEISFSGQARVVIATPKRYWE